MIALPRQIRRPHQEPVDRLRTQPAFADGPDHQRLAAAHVAGGEDVGARGLVVDHVGADVAALVEVDAEHLEQALVHEMDKAHGEQHELGVVIELGAGQWLELVSLDPSKMIRSRFASSRTGLFCFKLQRIG
jgi:hypothetical protein